MQPSLIFVPVVLPVLFWAWYHYYKDRRLPEPVGYLVLAFLLGAGSYWLGILMYEGLGVIGLRFDAFLLAETDHGGLLLYAILAIGPIEELAKLLPFMLLIFSIDEFDEPIDGIIYASFIALGFSTVENLYYLQYVSDIEALARGFAGPVVHIVFASIWGYYIGRAFLRRRSVALTVFVSLMATAVLHGLYDYLVIALPIFALPASALLVVGIWVWRLFLIRDLDNAARNVAGSA
jgi:RsiW-degrading membrane proteinase PrsW (M82 family)